MIFRSLFPVALLLVVLCRPVVLRCETALEILQTNCSGCHAAQVKQSGFSVANTEAVIAGGKKHGRAVIGGHPEKSPLVQMIKGEILPRMPMGKSLDPASVVKIEEWIRSLPADSRTAKQEWRWPYQKPVNTAANGVDDFVLAKLREKGIAPAPRASKRTLARRVFFDLVGMPPSIDEMNEFLRDESEQAFEKLVERLLADSRYGERWGRHWLDLVRYAETSGLEGDGPIGNVWRYRDWVIDAFNSNMPYDRFILQQIAGGDEHSKTRNNYAPDVQGYIPTAFLRVAPWDRSNLVAAEVRANYLAEVTTATSSIFLGLTVGCARCHDHKYDPISQKDFYRFQAFFNATQAAGSVDVPFKDEAWKLRSEAAVKALDERLKDGPEKNDLDAFEKELLAKLRKGKAEKAAGKEYTSADLRLEMKLKSNRVFSEAEKLAHAKLLEDALRTDDLEEQTILKAFEKPALEKLKVAYTTLDPNERFEALTVADVRAEAQAKYSGKSIFSIEEKNRHAELSGQIDILKRRRDRWKTSVLAVTNVAGPPSGPDIAATRILIRGNYNQPGDVVEAGFPTAFTGKPEAATLETDRYRQFPTRGHRITLAKWIASKDNPLTARVMVNRIWQHHFGSGIVRTPSDFGVNGERPTHPELLDWLAVKFVESGWDVKAMHKLILLSRTYAQSAENPAAMNADPENKLFSRFPRLRLEAEAIRDSVLFVSGRLSNERGGPSVFPPLPADLADFARYGRTGGLMWEPNENESDARRRSVYIFQRRSLPLPMMAAFDALPFSESCDRRSSTTTPLQALSMMNGDLMLEESEHLAAKVAREAGAARSAQINRMFHTVLSRDPSATELKRFDKSELTLAGVGRVLLNSNEFLYVE